MALWQFTLDPIPASRAQVEGMGAIRLKREQLDAIRLPIAISEQKPLFDELARLLPEAASWSQDMRIWGDVKSHDITVFFDSGEVEAIQVRLDVSKPAMSLVHGLCEIARRHGWVFATRDGKIVQPTAEAIVRAMMQSDASRFVRDPRGYLEDVAPEDRGTE